MRRYDKYKDSGIEWLGEVPEHWEVKRVKDLGYLQNGVSKGKDYFGFGYPFVSYGNVYNNKVSSKHIKTFANSSFEEQKLYSVKEGDVFFTRTSETVSEIGISATCLKTIPKATFSGFVIRLRANKNKIYKKFSKYFFRAYINQIYLTKETNIVTRASLSQDTLYNLPVLLPNIPEQITIGNYLDIKTQLIDKKIELLTKKIETYKELRKTLINKVVCRGLNENVELKDSGVDWIGKIPEHWEVKRVKDIFEIGRGRVIAQTELLVNGKYPVYSSQTENNGCLGFINTYDFNCELLTWTTDGVNAGTVFQRNGKFNCTNICGTLKAKRGNLKYLSFSLQQSTKHNKRIDTNGAKIMNNEMSIIHFVYPSIEEQNDIVEYLENKTNKIDTIITNIQQQIQKLHELRKTLINDVVTGKIKVTE